MAASEDGPDPPPDATGEPRDSGDGSPAQAPKAAFDRRRSIIGGVVAVAFLVVVFWRVIPQVGDYAGAFEVIANLGLADLALLGGALLVYLGVYGLPYLAAAPGISYKDSEVVNNSRFAIGNGIPAGGALSVGVGYAQLTFYGQTPTAATAAIGASGVWAAFVTLTLPITGVAALAMSGADVSRYLVPALIGVAALTAAVVVFALILRSEPAALRVGAFGDRVIGAILHRIRPHSSVNITGAVVHLRRDIVSLVNRRWVFITLANLGVALGQFLILATAVSLVSDTKYSMLAVYGSWAVSQLGIMIPVTPGGLGTVDAALIALLVANGMSQADATAAALVWRVTYYFPQIILGVLCIFYWRWQTSSAKRIGVSPATK